jgi:hypothetical protein
MSVNIEFRWNQEVYKLAGEIAYKYKMAYTWKKYLGYFFIGLIIIGLIKLKNSGDFSVIYIGAILSIYWYFIRGFLYKSRLLKNFKKEGISELTMHFNITKGGININGNMIPWRDITLVVVHPSGFLIERPEGYPYIPATAFSKDKEVEFFLKLLEKNEIPLKKVV